MSANSPARPRTPATRRPPDRRPPKGDPARLAALLTLVWLEIRAGRRPASQITPLTAPALRRRLYARIPSASQLAGSPVASIRHVRSFAPTPEAREVTVIVAEGQRVVGYAVRIEQHHGAWRAVELAAPDDGLPALRTASRATPPPMPVDAFDEVLAGEGRNVATDAVQAP